ncbi:DUF3105 domain-containing protein [Arthrobacter castelli]|uniref:DUF3105 domain-containing protein n=1 Tax=Arthrobacter castelli TaxID=271431 RepID=UPI0003F77B49|nr:DUF3105 domain-containing protein [Arthrobacter castelli]
MANTKRQTSEGRRAKSAAIRARQQAAERRQKFLVYGISSLVVAALIGAVAFVLVGEAQRQAAVEEAAGKPIEGVRTFDDLSRTHVRESVNYEQTPGAGGDHAPVWTNCGTYTSPVDEKRAIHSLEHGAVWLTYSQDLPEAQVEQLADLTESRSYVLLSPYPGQQAPLKATAWGTQVSLDGAGDQRLEPFIAAYAQGPQTPEPGAACSGGVDG